MPTTAPLRVVQISDLHLKTTPGNQLWGADVDAGLSAVLAHTKDRNPPPEFVPPRAIWLATSRTPIPVCARRWNR